jgi:SpoVK/Ycf46/Vps4 family AAA+-type ATPase
VANAEQIKALVKCHLDGDDQRFLAIALQLAAAAARQGHGKFAQELKALVDIAKDKSLPSSSEIGTPVPVVQPRGELAGLLSVQYSKLRLSDLSLSQSILERLQRVVIEHANQHKLRSYGLSPRRKLLLVGPPGSGKTMTASALAGEMRLPLFTILLDGLITKYMGETAAKLRLIFDAIQKTRAVYLFDEFDAIAVKRHARNDVGEIRRILNSFLQFVEQDESDSVVIGATNHPELLDRAVFRRFDDVIEYSYPTNRQVEQVIRDRLCLLNLQKLSWSEVVSESAGLSFADITGACNDAAKEAILSDCDEVTTRALVRALKGRRVSATEE